MPDHIKRAIVTGGTHNDVAPIAVFAINIQETNDDLFDELVIFHDGIKSSDQNLIKSIFPTRFIRYTYPNKSRNDIILSYFSEMVFCKYECFRLLDDYEEVVWSDYDVVIYDKLEDFCKKEDESMHVLSADSATRAMFYKDIKSDEILNYDLEKDNIGTPLFWLSDSIADHENIHKWCYEKTKLWDEDLYLPEQGIISLAVQNFNISIRRYDFDTYACYPTKYSGKEIIIHAAGQPKFWNGLKNADWDHRYDKWIKMGGTPYHEQYKKIKRFVDLVKARMSGVHRRDI